MPEVPQQFSEGRRRKTTNKCAVETGCGEKGVQWKDLENDGKRTMCMWDVGLFYPRKKQRKEFPRAEAEEEKQAGIQGQWQLETPAREHLEQVKCCHDTDCTERMVKKGFTALKGGDWEECKTLPEKK